MRKLHLILLLFMTFTGIAQTPALRYNWTYGESEYLISRAQSTRLNADISSAQNSLNKINGNPHVPFLQSLINGIDCQDCESPSKISVQITDPLTGSDAPVNQWLTIQSDRIGEDEAVPYFHVINTSTGYVKLKVGYEGTISGLARDVLAGGNTHLEIILKTLKGSVPAWTAIRLRPEAIGLLNLGSYITGNAEEYTTISIPLSDFDPTIDFTGIRYIEFPYSANAGDFELAIKSIKFVGGSTPFEWFGENHFNNPHDGATTAVFGEIIESIPEAVYCDTLFLYVDDTLRDYSTIAPYPLMYKAASVGVKPMYIKLKDNMGNVSNSNTILLNFQKVDLLEITLTFESTPSYCIVDKSPLLYNKDFAYSLTFDDGRIDSYDYAYPLFSGGTVEQVSETFPGLFYTDGTGKDIAFNAGLAWNSVSSNYGEIHEVTPSYITWDELIELYDSNWDVYNHGYSHNTTLQGADIAFEIMANDTAIQHHTTTQTHHPVIASHFVLPSADLNFVVPAQNYGYQGVYSNSNTFTGYPNGFVIDEPYNPIDIKMYRRLLTDELHNPSNVMEYMDQTASVSGVGSHYWINDFTHRNDTTHTGASITWDTFKYYMQTIESTYGKNGSDRIWFASISQVQEYLRLRNEVYVSRLVSTNTVKISLNVADVPEYIRRKELSLLIDSDLPIQNIEINFNGSASYNPSNLSTQLINVQW